MALWGPLGPCGVLWDWGLVKPCGVCFRGLSFSQWRFLGLWAEKSLSGVRNTNFLKIANEGIAKHDFSMKVLPVLAQQKRHLCQVSSQQQSRQDPQK